MTHIDYRATVPIAARGRVGANGGTTVTVTASAQAHADHAAWALIMDRQGHAGAKRTMGRALAALSRDLGGLTRHEAARVAWIVSAWDVDTGTLRGAPLARPTRAAPGVPVAGACEWCGYSAVTLPGQPRHDGRACYIDARDTLTALSLREGERIRQHGVELLYRLRDTADRADRDAHGAWRS